MVGNTGPLNAVTVTSGSRGEVSMRVAVVTESWWPSTDGVVTWVSATVRELKRRGHTVLIIAPRGGGSSFEGMAVKDVPNFSIFFVYGGKPWGLPLPRVGAFLKAFQPDVVHVVNPGFLGMAGVYAARRLHIPLVESYHTDIAQYAAIYHFGLAKPVIWQLLRIMHNRAAVNLAVSESVKAELEAHHFQRVQVWKRGVDLTLFHPARQSPQMRSLLTNGHPEKILALYVGRIAREKGLYRLRGIFALNPSIHLALVGEGPALAEVRQIFEDTPTTFVGKLLGTDLAAAYASADLFVFPSTTETLGLVLLEAMASGLPVVAAASGPTHELIDPSGAGLLFPANKPEHIGMLIKDLVHGGIPLHVRSGRARAEAEKWGWDRSTEDLITFYLEAMQYRPSGL